MGLGGTKGGACVPPRNLRDSRPKPSVWAGQINRFERDDESEDRLSHCRLDGSGKLDPWLPDPADDVACNIELIV